MTQTMPWDAYAEISAMRLLEMVSGDVEPYFLVSFVKQMIGDAFNDGMSHAIALIKGEAE